MKTILGGLGGVALAAALAVAPVDRAKADGGAVAVGIGTYLVVDYLVGETCAMHVWPFNIIKKTAYELKGKLVCDYRRSDRKYR